MSFRWNHENPPEWDGPKAAIIGCAPQGIFHLGPLTEGELVPGEWWRVDDDDGVAGYGWMDTTWGDAEILLAVDPAHRRRGVGTFILDQLQHEATTRGLHYLYNVVSDNHPDRDGITKWLRARHFEPSGSGRLMRSVVRAT